MDRKQIDAEQIIPRYLAGQLEASEDAAFEAFAARHPEIYRDVERLFRLKEGLAVLRDQSQLDSLLRTPPSRSYTRLAAAAAVLLVMVGAAVFWYGHERPPVALAAAVTDFAHNTGRPALVGSYVLVRSRNLNDAIDLQLPPQRGVTQLRVLPSSPSAGGDERYTASLVRVTSNGHREAVGEVAGLAAGADLYVTLYVDSVGLRGGDYEILLSAQQSPSESGTRERFTLRLP